MAAGARGALHYFVFAEKRRYIIRILSNGHPGYARSYVVALDAVAEDGYDRFSAVQMLEVSFDA